MIIELVTGFYSLFNNTLLVCLTLDNVGEYSFSLNDIYLDELWLLFKLVDVNDNLLFKNDSLFELTVAND